MHKLPLQFIGICQGILADGNVSANDIRFLQEWISGDGDTADHPTIKKLCKKLDKALLDGRITNKEADALHNALTSLILDAGQDVPPHPEPETICDVRKTPKMIPKGNAQLIPAEQDIFDVPESLDFTAHFCFTGNFAYGERHDCERITMEKGATVKALSGAFQGYLVVGSVASKDWTFGNYGRKIEKALVLKEKKAKIFIIHEDTWAEALSNTEKDTAVSSIQLSIL